MKTCAFKTSWNPSNVASGTYIISPNTPPTASFTVNPSSGTKATTFNFDASGSTDSQDATSQLQVRWDWENDGAWDTDYSTTKTATHQFSSGGTVTVKLEVKDTGGLTSQTTKTVGISETGTVMDIDGNTYQTIKIGNQWWMMENLKVTRYRNGDAIPNVTGNVDWSNLTTGAYCIYNNDANNTAIYGRLYNWHAINDSRNIVPTGWHIPSDAEWQTLVDYLGGDAVAGGKMKETGMVHWLSPNSGATNESGFSALPGGYRTYTGTYDGIGASAVYWSSTDLASDAWTWGLGNSTSGVSHGSNNKRLGFSVRCIRD